MFHTLDSQTAARFARGLLAALAPLIFARLIGAGFLVVGAFQLIWCVSEALEAARASRWPTTLGTITVSEVLEVKGRGGVGHVPHVMYTYDVDGVAYTGQRIHMRDVSEPAAMAQSIIQSYPHGEPVRVHFNPKIPAESMLRPGVYFYSFAWLALSILAVAVGVVLFVHADRKRLRGSPPTNSFERTRGR